MAMATSRRTGWTCWTATRSRAAAEELGDVDILVFTAATNVRKRLLDYARRGVRPGGRPQPAGLVRPGAGLRGGMAERGSGSIIGFARSGR